MRAWMNTARPATAAAAMRALGRDLAGLIGLAMIIHGVDLLSRAAAWIVAGLLVTAMVVLQAKRS